ncbi:hypothetical protein BN440_1581 [Erwinia amylovora MR1]|nr:hypothetical protein BN440_1581 [Erwinia amylovora MR1]
MMPGVLLSVVVNLFLTAADINGNGSSKHRYIIKYIAQLTGASSCL